MERTNCSITYGALKVGIADGNLIYLSTEGQRGTLDYGVLPIEDVRRSHEEGYRKMLISNETILEK
jgi:hypothetical protein